MSSVAQTATQRQLQALTDARARTLELVADLRDSELVVPRLDIVNPILWELGHVGFFYEAFLVRELGCSDEVILPGSDELFHSFEVAHDSRWDLFLPDREQTIAYLERVDGRVRECVGKGEHDPRTSYLLQLAVLHEDMHGEALIYTRQTLGLRPPPTYRARASRTDPGSTAEGALPGDVRIEGGRFELGCDGGEAHFVFDNEKQSHPVHVAPFAIARAPVTQQEYARFVEDGGYGNRNHWGSAGWLWLRNQKNNAPATWRRAGSAWERLAFDRWVPLEPHLPVSHVSWYEAEAYCRWAGRRLPTEVEWEYAATGGARNKLRFPWGDGPPESAHANLDGRRLGCVEVAAHPDGDSPFGCRQMIGNVWEWTASDFRPYPGFRAEPPYLEYSEPWFGDRKVLRGGSWATRGRLLASTHRNFFTPDRNDILAGFRTCPL